MSLPQLEDLNALVALIAGCDEADADFYKLSIPDRMRIVEIANQCDTTTMIADAVEKIDSLATDITVGIAEAMAEHSGVKKLVEGLDNIDSTLSHVSRWFELSRLYQP